mgnify:CR=1 FL=1
MANEEWKRDGQSTPTGEGSERSETPEYRYRWRYDEQCAYDAQMKKKQRKSGALVYALVTVFVFMLCFALLAATLIWYQAQPSNQGNVPIGGGQTGGALTTGQVSEIITPATVLVYAANETSYAYGTGFFLTTDGYLATNYHVVENADYYAVSLSDAPNERIEAELVGYRKNEDLAVLKIKGTGYVVPAIGNSDGLHVGDVAIAVGNPSGEDGAWSTTQGIVSALNRKVTVTVGTSAVELSMIQTDAALNPGNSGGPLCNDRAEVIGIVTRKKTDTEGISYALPINGAMEILRAIVEKGHADDVNPSFSKVRPVLGISCTTVEQGDEYTYRGQLCIAETDGILVTSITSGSGADGKLQVGDIICSMGGKRVRTVEELTEQLYTYSVGDEVSFKVQRNGESVTVKVELGAG